MILPVFRLREMWGQRPWVARIAGVLLTLTGAAPLSAAPVDGGTALDAVTGWLDWSPAPLGRRAGSPGPVTTISDAAGQPLFHVVKLEPKGFAIVAADDELETVVAFSHEDSFVAQPGRGYYDLLVRDLTSRMQEMRAADAAGRPMSAERVQSRTKWRALLARSGRGAASLAATDAINAYRVATINDVRVEPMVRTRWSQDTITVNGRDVAVYNYYTPRFGDGDPRNYPSGCVATAWAQIMNFHRWPTGNATTQLLTIQVDGSSQSRTLRGGDGEGGPYEWDSMVNEPNGTTTDVQRQAIGALMHDAGVGINMSYTSSASAAWLSSRAVRNVFQYASAAYLYHPVNTDDYQLAFRTNLDAGLPVGIAISGLIGGQRIGHEPVVDGYGYNLATPYVHLNMGWGGESDAWYNLPTVDDGHYGFDSLDACTFNIMPQTTGEIVSGRITGPDGTALAGITVTLNDGTAHTTVTNAHGIFAVKGVRSNSTVTVEPRAATYVFSPAQGTVTTGLTQDYSVGNRTADFTSRLRTATDTRYTPVVTWATPSNIGEGTSLSSAQLNATADVPGTFSYSPAAGTVLPIGTHTLSVTFTPNDPTLYNSATAQVSLTVTAGRSQLVNISARAYCGTGNSVTIGGFVVTGSATKRVLIRAVGPSLASQGLGQSEVLADPQVEVYRRGTIVAQNDNWGDNANAAEITSLGAQIGAAALASGDTRSSALLIALPPGVYSFIVKGRNDTSGIVLLEVYDAETSNTGAKFVNIAARGQSAANNGVAIGGFVITGNVPKRILMRAIGTTLTTQGIGTDEVLGDPTIELHSRTATIATIDDWGTNPNQAEIVATGARIGATPIDQADTHSAALLTTLAPGVYSFIAKGKNSTTGIVLVEVYDAD